MSQPCPERISGVDHAGVNFPTRENYPQGVDVHRDLLIVLRPRAAGLELENAQSIAAIDDAVDVRTQLATVLDSNVTAVLFGPSGAGK